MIEISRPISVPIICALIAMSLPGGASSQVTSDEFRLGPLCEAIVSGDIDRAMQLVKQGEDVNASFGCALKAAAQLGQLELVKQLLDHKADPNRRVPGKLIMGASTPLMAAVMSRRVQMVQLLLQGGANPRNDFRAFQGVLHFGDVDMAELLLSQGANANMTYPAGGEDIYASPDGRKVKVPRTDLEPDRIDDTVKRLQCSIFTRSEGTSLLYLAVGPGFPAGRDGRERIAKLLIDRGADPNAKTLNGSTPLMFAASQHNHGAMTMLMDAGADVRAMDRCGRTAEEYAVLYPRHQRANLAPQTKALLQDR